MTYILYSLPLVLCNILIYRPISGRDAVHYDLNFSWMWIHTICLAEPIGFHDASIFDRHSTALINMACSLVVLGVEI